MSATIFIVTFLMLIFLITAIMEARHAMAKSPRSGERERGKL